MEGRAIGKCRSGDVLVNEQLICVASNTSTGKLGEKRL